MVPTDKIIIDSLKIGRNQGLYELGLIYKQQFVNLPLSIEKLERLLTLNPAENQLLSIYYNLYQIFSTVKNKPKETYYKNKILTDYADTKFAQLIHSDFDFATFVINFKQTRIPATHLKVNPL